MDGSAMMIKKTPQQILAGAGVVEPPAIAPLVIKIGELQASHVHISAEARTAHPSRIGPQANAAEIRASQLAERANEIVAEIAKAQARLRELREPYAAAVERLLTPHRQRAMRALAKVLAPGRPIPPQKDFAVDRIDIPRSREALDALNQIDAAMRAMGCESYGLRSWITPPLNWGRIAARLGEYSGVVGR